MSSADERPEKNGLLAKGVVRRACLECRARHLKCDGVQPICTRCSKASKSCTYVKSNRGGSRKRGVKKIKLHSTPESQSSSSSLSLSSKLSNSDITLPCVREGHSHLSKDPNCDQSCMKEENKGKLLPCMSNTEFKDNTTKNDNNNDGSINFHPKFNSSKSKESIDLLFDPKFLKPFKDYYISPALIRNLDIDNIINTYYQTFHNTHPFLPDQQDIKEYLTNIPHNYDLILSMQLIGVGQSSNKYSRDVETVNFLVNSILDYMKQIGKDFISLQSLLLLSMVAHISSLHDLSTKLREALVDLCLELNMHNIDIHSIPSIFKDVNGFVTETERDNKQNEINPLNSPTESTDDNYNNNNLNPLSDILNSPRLQKLNNFNLIETIRKTFWEIYFFDTLSGTASGHTMSKLAIQKILTFYPLSTPENIFDFKSRAESCKLVNDAIKLNVAIQANQDVDSHLFHMKAAISNWEMKMENPDLYKSPYLVNRNGIVNEGVHQSIMLVNYAKIFTHRPFSYLWRPDISKHPKCSDEEGISDNCEELKKQEMDSRKIIETRKTIDSANAVVRALIDTGPSQITKRTPFCACALAFSCLVHLSAYSWVESSLNFIKENKGVSEFAALASSVDSEELAIYAEYIKLELNGIYAISRHWALSSKLSAHIRDTLIKVSPKLYKIVQTSLPDSTNITPEPQSIGISIESSGDYTNSRISNNNNNNNNNIYTPHYGSSLLQTATISNMRSNSLQQDSNTNSSISSDLSKDYSLKRQGTTSSSSINDFSLRRDTITNTPDFYIKDEYSTASASSSFNNASNNFTGTSANSNTNTQSHTTTATHSHQHPSPTSVILHGNEIDFNEVFSDDIFSPVSDTGCDWVDKHIFEFDEFDFSDLPINTNTNTTSNSPVK